MKCDFKPYDAALGESAPCRNDATGAVRIEFWPHKAVQAMVKEPAPLQTMVLGLYVCQGCFSMLKPGAILAGSTLQSLERFAMQRNHGITVDRSETRLKHVALDDPEVQLLERTMAEKATKQEDERSGSTA